MRQASVHSDIILNLISFGRHLRAENLSIKTQETYCESVRQFVRFLESQGMSPEVMNLRREHGESFIEHLLEMWKPATANNRYRGLQSFFKWLIDEGEIKDNSIARMKPTRVPEILPDVLREDQLRTLLVKCERGQDFESRRDAALIRLFIDTGARLSEITGLRLDPKDDASNNVDLERGILRVLGKGRRE